MLFEHFNEVIGYSVIMDGCVLIYAYIIFSFTQKAS